MNTPNHQRTGHDIARVLDLRAWRHPGSGETRYYLNGWIGLRLKRPLSAGSRSCYATFDGLALTKEQTLRILDTWSATKVWFDETGQMHSGGRFARRLSREWEDAVWRHVEGHAAAMGIGVHTKSV